MTEIKGLSLKRELDENKIKEQNKIKEIPANEYGNVLKEQNNLIKTMSIDSLDELINQRIKDSHETKQGLTEDEKAKIKEAHPDWPDEIIDAIGSWKEYEVYDKANLKVEYINGRPCLVRTDIDMDQKDADGLTNRQRMKKGLPPITKDGKKVELHHIGQKKDSPVAELTVDEHRGKENDKILHDKTKNSEIDRVESDKERNKHWKTRSVNNVATANR